MKAKPTKKTKPGKRIPIKEESGDKKSSRATTISGAPEPQRVMRPPTTAELAQLAAALPPLKGRASLLAEWEQERYFDLDGAAPDGPPFSLSPTQILAREALVLWESCWNLLRDERDRELREGKTRILVESLERTALPYHPYLDPFQQVKGPFLFEEALKALVGGQTRRAERYGIFRNYLRHHFKESQSEGGGIEAKVEAMLAQLKANGFPSQERLCRTKEMLDEWRNAQRKAQARHAAKVRHKK